MSKRGEGSLIGFRIFFDETGTLISELRRLPEKDVSKIFKDPADAKIIKTVLAQTMKNFEGLHEKLEKELDALNANLDA
jgi:hypothetical protein|tara:strand:+ start:825 stop:1061 length:237 start_codon:yes stop_codon:yes gene_type:complete